MYVVRRAFRNLNQMMVPGSEVEPGTVKLFKTRLRDRVIIEVSEQDFDKWNEYFIKKYGTPIKRLPTDEDKSDEDKSDEDKSDEDKSDEDKSDEDKSDEDKSDEDKSDEDKTEEVKTEEVKTEEVKTEEVKTEEVKTEEVKPAVKVVAKAVAK